MWLSGKNAWPALEGIKSYQTTLFFIYSGGADTTVVRVALLSATWSESHEVNTLRKT